MSWASRRRTFVVGGVLVIIIGIIAVVLVATFYETPSCTDGVENQNEDGTDCGGPCAYLCRAGVAAPSVRFVRQLTLSGGRTDVIAYIDNPNPLAAVRGARFSIELYGPDNVILATKEGVVDLPPSSTVPVFVPEFFSGFQEVARAFLIFDDESLHWFRLSEEPIIPSVTDITLETGEIPRVRANLGNAGSRPAYAGMAGATAFDVSGNAIASSRTLISLIAAHGTAEAVFTWNEPFSALPARVEVVPVVSLSSP